MNSKQRREMYRAHMVIIKVYKKILHTHIKEWEKDNTPRYKIIRDLKYAFDFVNEPK